MKIKWKKFLATALSVVMTAASIVPLQAVDTGWKKDASGWQYQREGRAVSADSWMKEGENWYHFDSEGYMQTGWFQDTDKKWYFLDYHTGAMKTGWVKPADGKWYFLDYHTGAMKTGWIKPMDGKWYFMDHKTGAMQTGWFKDAGNKWYYLDSVSGEMRTGKVTIQGVSWTLQADGVWDGKNGVTESLAWVSSGFRSDSDKSDEDVSEQKPAFVVDKKTGNVTIYKEGVYSADRLGIREIQDLTISEQVGDGDITLDGLTVNGTTTIAGGGENTVHIVNCKLRIVIAAKRLIGGKNPLHISFEGNTTVSEAVHATEGKVKITIRENIVIPSITAGVESEIGGAGSVDTLKLTASIKISLSVKVRQLRVDSAAIKPEVVIQSNIEISEVAGVGAVNVKITGKGTVYGYYNLTLDANGGYWTSVDFDGEETEETQLIVKVKLGQSVGETLREKEVLPPSREGMEFNGWYIDQENSESQLDLDQIYCDRPYTFYAGWVELENIVPVKTATISGGGYADGILTAEANKDATGILTYQWYECETQDGSYQPIERATLKQYVPGLDKVGHYIKVEISSNHSQAGVWSEAVEILEGGSLIPDIEGTIKKITVTGENKVTYALEARVEWEDEGNFGFYEWLISDQKDGEYRVLTSGSFRALSVYRIREEDAGKYIKIRIKSLNELESEPIQIREEIPIIVKKLEAEIVVSGASIQLVEKGISTSDETGYVNFMITASGSAITVDQKTKELVVSGSAVKLSQIQTAGKNNKELEGTYVWDQPDQTVKENKTYSLYFIPETLEGEPEQKIKIYVTIDVEFPPEYDEDVDIDIDIDIDIDLDLEE